MIDAAGIDLGEVTSAAARRHGDEVEPVLVLPTADLDGGATTQHRLASLAARLVGPDPLPAVAVAVPTIDAAAQAELESAARAAFEEPLLVPRPLAAARWFTHTNEVHPDAVLVIVEAEESRVAVTAVRAGPGGVAIARPPAGWPSIGTTDVVGAVAASAAAWGFVPRDIDVAVIVGVAATMAGLPEGITAATGLTSVVDREPLAAAACGAALLVREPVTRLGAALAIGVPAVGAAMLAAPEDGAAVGGGVAAAAGEALSGEAEGGGVAAAAGEALSGEAEGGGVAAAAGRALSGTKIHPAKRPPKNRPRALRPKAALLLAPVVVTLGLGTVVLRSCAGDAGTPDLVTSAAPAEPGDPPRSTTTIGPRQGSDGAGVPKGTPGQAVPASEPPTSTTSRPRSTTTAPPATPGPPTPATPAPQPPDVPPSVTNLARTVESIGADASDSPFGGGCQIPETTNLSATVTDASGLASVRVTWSTTWGHSGTIDMARGAGDVWTATLGPIKDAQRFTDESTPVTWSVEAVDTAGHSQTVTAGPDAGVTLHGCVIVLT